MQPKTQGKWQWIEESLTELDLPDLAARARQIKSTITSLYGYEITELTYPKINQCDRVDALRRILDATEQSSNCTPCQLSKTCLSCLFAAAMGPCRKSSSSFFKFRSELEELYYTLRGDTNG